MPHQSLPVSSTASARTDGPYRDIFLASAVRKHNNPSSTCAAQLRHTSIFKRLGAAWRRSSLAGCVPFRRRRCSPGATGRRVHGFFKSTTRDSAYRPHSKHHLTAPVTIIEWPCTVKHRPSWSPAAMPRRIPGHSCLRSLLKSLSALVHRSHSKQRQTPSRTVRNLCGLDGGGSAF